ncbi:hypothetical protein JCM8547_008756 [Rhodosporidiobolus lusitaniae]
MNTDVEKTVKVEEMQEVSHNERAPRFADGESLAPVSTEGTGKDNSSSKYASSTIGLEHRTASQKEERKLVRKLDVLIIPLAVLLYLAAYLDRGALGNSKLLGLESTVLHNSDTGYSVALTCFYITYILLSIPGTLLAKAIDPSTSIAAGAFIWSVAASAQAGVHNQAGLYVCRLFIGVGEALFGQAMALYFTYWYRKNEIAKRIGLFISAGSLAGAFSGIIAYGVARIPSPALDAWRVLFLIEGLPSILLAIVVFLFLPSRPNKSRYLNEDERTIACTRLNADSLGTESGMGIDWRAVRYTLTDWKTYVISIAYSAMNLTLGSVSGFLPQIVKDLGYSNADAQLYTVPPYAVALGTMLFMTAISDKYRTRGIPAMIVFAIGITGWSILLGVDPVGVTEGGLRARYFACCCLASAGYSNIPIIMAWVSNNSGCETQRAVGLGSLNAIGQCLSILAAFLFPKPEGPRYRKGATVNIAFQCLGLVIALSMTLYYRWENARRDRKEGGRPAKGMPIPDILTDYDRAVGFRYTP